MEKDERSDLQLVAAAQAQWCPAPFRAANLCLPDGVETVQSDVDEGP